VDDDGEILANDGESVGEFEIRGRGSPPPITGTTTGEIQPRLAADRDVGTLDRLGFMTITDRTKDVIKSGGEWISSVELEGEVMAHRRLRGGRGGRPRRRWQERPLVCVVPVEVRARAPRS